MLVLWLAGRHEAVAVAELVAGHQERGYPRFVLRDNGSRCQDYQGPILRLRNLHLPRERCSRFERFSKYKKIYLFSKSTCGVVTQGLRIGSRLQLWAFTLSG
jgi:hypothetical protein